MKRRTVKEVVLYVAPGVMQSVVHVWLNGRKKIRREWPKEFRISSPVIGCAESIAESPLQFIAPGAMARYPKLQF